MSMQPTYSELENRIRVLEQGKLEHQALIKEQLMMVETLQMMNESEDLKRFFEAFVERLGHWSGCEAIAVRLEDEPDFPYFATRGFPDRFVEMERTLCQYGPDGKVRRDAEEKPILECMCGNIIYGKVDPTKSFFTPEGDFWSNCTTRLLATTTEKERQGRTRNRCNGSGYESVALIPLRWDERTLGLIQLNDHREGMFTAEKIGMFRRLADYLAGFLAKRQTEDKLRKSEMQLRVLINSLPDLVWLKDPDGVYLSCNTSFERAVGVPEKEIVGKTDYDFFAAELADFFRENDRVAAAAGQPRVNEEEVLFGSNGHPQILETIKAPLYDDKGRLTGVLGIARDITSRKQAELERSKMHEQLVQAQKMESVGRLAGGIAHDLNNLLMPILGYSDLLADDLDLHGEHREMVTEILAAGQRARDLVRQLLAFSRKQTLLASVADLNDIIRRFQKLLQRTIPEDIQIVTELSAMGLTVVADIGQIEQVIMNLSVNAADAMPDGGVLTMSTSLVELDSAHAGTHQDLTPGTYALLAVKDTGHGMDEETCRQIFDPFFSTKGEQGTGLGLATVYGIVKQHHGSVSAHSEPGRGTTFKIYLPITNKKESVRAETDESVHAAGNEGLETVLLVEDNEDVCRLVHNILVLNGYKVIVAKSGTQALEYLDRNEIPLHLLLTDVVMPGMNGRELYERVQQKCPGIRVLYMSGYADNLIAHRGVLEGKHCFLEKPFSKKSLEAKVRATLDAT